MKRWVWLLALVGACARQGTIPGGPPDRVPPIVVETRPGPLEVVPEWRQAIVIRFNERISERGGGGSLAEAVLVSPEVEDLKVQHKRDGLEISAPGGFPAGKVYRVLIRPQIQDLFGNTLRDPFELVFSTGPEPVPTVVAGSVLDRLTDQPRELRVDAVEVESGETYPTRSDREGIFALRFLPPGRYRLRAFEDRNRNGAPDFSEPKDELTALLNSGQDTVLYTLRVLEGDSTAARLARVEVRDSLTLELFFDDYLDPDLPLNTVRVRFAPEGEAVADTLPNAERFLHPHQYEELLRERAAEADSAAAAPTPAAPPVRVPVSPLAQTPGGARAEPGKPLPAQNLFVLLDRALPVAVPLKVEVSGVVNIHRILLGGGEASLEREAPPPDTVPAVVDTLGPGVIPAGADTSNVVDSLTVGDTTAVADTVVVPDTIRIFRPLTQAATRRETSTPGQAGVRPHVRAGRR